jgi:lysyl-tRNA synthetase class 2
MGIELANGYEELRDPVEINQRFRSAAEQRRRRGLTEVALDPAFVEASGEMPACAGVALGLDRLIMVWLERSSLREVQINFAAD